MRMRAWAQGVVGVLLLQGAGWVQAGSGVQLFAEHGEPRFSFYLACVSKTVNCEIIERMFSRWADARELAMHAVTPDEAAHDPDHPAAEGGVPYRVTVRYAPEMATYSNSFSSGASGMPVVSYQAIVRVFDATSGKLVKSMNWHNEKMVDRAGGAANPYLEAQVRDFLKHLDPAYPTSAD